eukprot:tig00001299_g8070.t1
MMPRPARLALLACCLLVLVALASAAEGRRKRSSRASQRVSKPEDAGGRLRALERIRTRAAGERKSDAALDGPRGPLRKITRRTLANSLRSGGAGRTGRSPLSADELRTVDRAGADPRPQLVHVHASRSVSDSELRSLVAAAGGTVEHVHRDRSRLVASARVPAAGLEQLASAAEVQAIRAPAAPRLRGATGPLRSGLEALNLHQWVPGKADGAGITVGVLSDSFDCLKGADKDIRAGALPGPGNPRGRTQPVRVLKELVGDANCTDEGRAMLQLVHAIAPGAALCFASAYPDELAFLANMEALAAPPCSADVIVDDVGFPDEPAYSDTLVAERVAALVARGVAVLSAAGNDGSQTAEMWLYPDTTDLPDVLKQEEGYLGWQILSEEAESPYLMTLWVEETSDVWLQWNDPVDVPGAVSMDLDLFLYKDGKLFDYSDDYNNDVRSPIESIGDIPPGQYQVAVALWDYNATTPFDDERKIFLYSTEPLAEAEWTSFEADRPARSVWGHSADAGILAVGSVQYYDASGPAYYSSEGPATVYYDAHGAPLFPPQVRLSPAVAGVDCVDTTFFGDEDPERNGFPNFCGTSASAAHVAGLAALLLQASGGPKALPPPALAALLARSTPGGPWLPKSGHGLVDGGRALEGMQRESGWQAMQGQVAQLAAMAGILRNASAPVPAGASPAQVQRLADTMNQVRSSVSALQGRVAELSKAKAEGGDVAELARQVAALAQRLEAGGGGGGGGGAGSTAVVLSFFAGSASVLFLAAAVFLVVRLRQRRDAGLGLGKGAERQRGFELVGEGDLEEDREPA